MTAQSLRPNARRLPPCLPKRFSARFAAKPKKLADVALKRRNYFGICPRDPDDLASGLAGLFRGLTDAFLEDVSFFAFFLATLALAVFFAMMPSVMPVMSHCSLS